MKTPINMAPVRQVPAMMEKMVTMVVRLLRQVTAKKHLISTGQITMLRVQIIPNQTGLNMGRTRVLMAKQSHRAGLLPDDTMIKQPLPLLSKDRYLAYGSPI